MIKVTIWNEFRHEKHIPEVKELYPEGIHACIKGFLSDCEDMEVRIVSLDDPEQGLPDAVLNDTDVLMWWGHLAHHEVSDELVERIRQRVYAGMGFVPMHSAHFSKPFRAILGTTGNLTWGRECHAVVWNLCPSHPIAAGIPAHFDLGQEEIYSEPFYIPKPDDLVFATWFEDGNLFRGGATFTRGCGKIFYFHPGHETARSFYNPYVQQILKNAIRWVAPTRLDPSMENENREQRTPVV